MKIRPVHEPGKFVPGAANANVRVLCAGCGKWVLWVNAFVDLQGEPFKSYYHEACAPVDAEAR